MSQPTRQEFRLVHRLRVRWSEIDLQRIVFNPHYLTYVDTTFTEYWRALAVAYEDIPGLLGGDLYVKKSTVEYHGSARLDDLLDIGLRCQRIGNSSMLFQAGIFRAEELLVTCELVYVFADPATQTSRPVPPALRALIEGYEAGAASVDLRLGSWAELGAQARALREQVFLRELHIDAPLQYDAVDETAVQLVACNRLGQPVGTGRLVCGNQGVARLGRLAVAHPLRGTGLGRSMVRALEEAASARGIATLVLRAQSSALGFYERLGYARVGDPVVEAGLPHVDMERRLQPADSYRSASSG